MIQVHRDLNNLPKFKNAVVTIGTFDGVHTGHQQIIKQLKNEAVAINGETVIITFYPHPRKIISAGTNDVRILTTLDEKIDLLNKHGVDHLVVVEFTNEFAQQSAAEYVKDFIVAKFHPSTLIIGYDHRFGKNRTGDYHLLEEMGEVFNYKVKEIPGHILHNITISSTKIRAALLSNDIATTNEFLGYEYFFSGEIIEGDKIGRTIGYPTANFKILEEEKLVPGDGVYAVKVSGENLRSHSGMMYIGTRPVVNGKYRVIEVNLFDFDGDVYGQILKVEIHYFIRGDIHFTGLEPLKIQLAKDKEATLLTLESKS
jgi:riboflavin kinase/FMN adenylyltransferase